MTIRIFSANEVPKIALSYPLQVRGRQSTRVRACQMVLVRDGGAILSLPLLNSILSTKLFLSFDLCTRIISPQNLK